MADIRIKDFPNQTGILNDDRLPIDGPGGTKSIKYADLTTYLRNGAGTTGEKQFYDKNDIDSSLSAKSDTSHTHDDRYYTETELSTGGVLDSRYYTETEIDTQLEVVDNKVNARELSGGVMLDGLTCNIVIPNIDISGTHQSFEFSFILTKPVYPLTAATIFRKLAAVGSTNEVLIEIREITEGENYFRLYFCSAGGLTNYSYWDSQFGIVDLNKSYHLIATNDNGVVKAYLNEIEIILTKNNLGTGFDGEIINTGAPASIGVYTDGGIFRFGGNIFLTRIYNRTLTPTEVANLASGQPLPLSDRWGEGITTQEDFSDNSNNWQQITGNSAITGNALVYTSVTANSGAYTDDLVEIEAGVSYRVKYTISGYTEGQVHARLGAIDNASNNGTIRTANGTYEEVITPLSVVSNQFWFKPESTSTLTIDDVEIERLGCVASFEPHLISAYQWQDASTNKLHALASATGVTPIKEKRTGLQLRDNTATSGNEWIGGSDRVVIPTNALLRYAIANTAGTPDVTAGTAASGTQLFTSTTLAAGRNVIEVNKIVTTGKISVGSSSADSIDWTFIYDLVD